MNKSIKTAVYLILTVLAAMSVFLGAKNALAYSQDFQYDAALALRSGINPYKESLDPSGVLETGATADFYRTFEEAGAPQKMEANQFPSLLMLLFPITFIPFGYARILWLFLNLLFTVLIIMLLRRTFFKEADKDIFILLMLLMIAGTPWRNQIGVGQHTLFSFFFFLLAVFLSERNMDIPSALALSVSYFKYTLTAPLALYFLYKRKYKVFIISLIPHIAGNFIGAGMLGESFIDMIREPLKVSSALTGEGTIDIGTLSGGAGWSVIITGIIMLALLVTAFILPAGMDRYFFSLLVLSSLIMTYHRIYDFFMMIPATVGVLLLYRTGNAGRLLLHWYAATVFFFFFIQRVFFGKSIYGTVMIIGAVIYYGFMVLFTGFIVKESHAGQIIHSDPRV